MPLTNHSRNSDGTYGPTKRNKLYKPKSDHGLHSRNQVKTKWAHSEGYEYDVFYQCDLDEFFCPVNECFFGIIDKGAMVLGRNGERMAKFPITQNTSDAWHGYPVSTGPVWDKPCETILDNWEVRGIISFATKRRIEKGLL